MAVTPAVLLGAFLWHPYLPGRLPNHAAIAAAVSADTTRWAFAHLAAGVASAVVALAFLAIRSYLREAGEDRWSMLGLPFIVTGSVLYAMLPGLEFAPLAAAEVGADVQAVQAALATWFVPVLAVGAITFAFGVFGFTRAIARSAVLRPGLSRLVVGALVVMAASRVVPFAAVQFYVQSVAAMAAMWPLAYAMRTHPAARAAGHPQPMPAT